MDTPTPPKRFSWDGIKLAVFDVDGTLYHQPALRLRMARDMILHAVKRRSTRHIKVLSAYRKIREELGDNEVDGFDPVLVARTSAMTGTPADRVKTIVAEWMENRPLRYMQECRYPGINRLFEGLHANGKIVGVLSDYPVPAKLAAMELSAHHVVCAGDADVGILKPHPRGLQRVIEAAGVAPEETVLIGDRIERDGIAAERAGAHALIKSDKAVEGWTTFRAFDDPVFAPILEGIAHPAAA